VGRVCEFELDACGDGVVQGGIGEECDDGGTADGDGCSASCEIEVPCGNGTLDAGEQCDDGNDDSGDGCSETCALERLWFSEYVEGSSNNKALEIKNPLSSPIDLTGCSIQAAFNGSNAFGAPIALTATVPANDVLVVCNTGMNASVACDVRTNAQTMGFNGDDTLGLFCGTTLMDVIGQLGNTPGGGQWGSGLTSTADNTIRRKCSVTVGDTDPSDAFNPATEWTGFANDTFTGLGDPACAP
ncbi:MAG TPA: DUF4215 domain-containing protein, partial [Kofleriaceae bacterium]|nr:DUF4215 domain-containing protein [Kofleriaceae bacterium]